VSLKCKHCRETVRVGSKHSCPVQNRFVMVDEDGSDFLEDLLVGAAVLGSMTDIVSSSITDSDSFSGGGGESGGGGASGDW